ncbi:MAG: signal peptidase II [Clostridia bacterium]|nr:signal peptidase II [Clostridia bacterium]
MSLKKYITKKKPWQYILYTAIIILGIILDQLTKSLATEYLKPIGTLPVIGGFAHLTYHINHGIAFGMLQGAGWLFNTITLIVVPVLGIYLYLCPIKSRVTEIALPMIITGGIGNSIDRLSLGYVVDFIDFSSIGFNAIFNVADSFVTVGAFMLIGALIFELVQEIRKESEAKKANNSLQEHDDNGGEQ